MSAKCLVNQFISYQFLFLLNSALSLKSRWGKVTKMSNICNTKEWPFNFEFWVWYEANRPIFNDFHWNLYFRPYWPINAGRYHTFKKSRFFVKIEMKSPKIIGSNKKMMVLKWKDFEVSKKAPFLEIRANVTCFA